jgi:hypothetical protein
MPEGASGLIYSSIPSPRKRIFLPFPKMNREPVAPLRKLANAKGADS